MSCAPLTVSAWLGVLGLLTGVSAVGAAEHIATVAWANRAELGTPLSGVVAKVAVRAGDEVAEGDLLLELDRRGLEAGVVAALAREQEAEADRAEAERELGRTQEMYDRTLLAEHDLQKARIALQAAEARFLAAQAAHTEADLNLEYSQVRAPFAGRVIAVAAYPGQVVVNRLQAQTLAIVAEGGDLVARVLATPEQAVVMAPGQPVQLSVGGRQWAGEVTGIGLEPISGSGESAQYGVDVGLALPEGVRLLPGQQVKVTTHE